MNDDEAHEALGAMIHRGKVDQRTAGRDYHAEIAAERDNLAAQLFVLQEWGNSRETVLEELALTRAERDRLKAYYDNILTSWAEIRDERDNLREAMRVAREIVKWGTRGPYEPDVRKAQAAITRIDQLIGEKSDD